MKKNIPYTYFKSTLLTIWILALLCIAGTWTTFMVGNNAAIAFGLITDILLTISLIVLAVLMIICGWRDYQTKAWLVILVTVIHIGFFITICVLQFINREWAEPAWAFAAGHTAILVLIVVVAIYLWLRKRFTFKHFGEKEDAIAAFGKPEKEEEKSAESQQAASLGQQEEQKPGRDEKTGIVTL